MYGAAGFSWTAVLNAAVNRKAAIKHRFCAFTRDDLVAIAKKRFGKSMHATSMGRLLRRLGLTRQKPRPNHPLKDPAAEAAFKKSPARAKKHSVYA